MMMSINCKSETSKLTHPTTLQLEKTMSITVTECMAKLTLIKLMATTPIRVNVWSGRDLEGTHLPMAMTSYGILRKGLMA